MKYLMITAVFAISLLSTSCKKEGCTDANAVNYSSEADTNDGSCAFEGNVVLWYGESTSNWLWFDSADFLTFYVDGQVVGSSASSVYWIGAPDCGDNSSITITKDLGNATSMASTYSVVDQDNNEIWAGVLNFTANTCSAIELIY